MGQTQQEISVSLDYLRYTAGRENKIDDLLPRNIPSLSRTGEILPYGSYGYDRTCPLEGGGRIMWNEEDAGMKFCVELSGEPLAEVRREGFEEEDLVTWCFAGKVARVSFARVDVAIDYKNGEGSIEEFYKSWTEKRTKTRAKQALWMESRKSEYRANTVYIGSRRTSPRFLRAYDKGVQTKSPITWLRLEAEVKKRRATPFAWSVSRHGTALAGRREIKEAILSTDVKWIKDALEGDLAPKVEAPRPEPRPNEFVTGMIIPFLKNHAHELTDETKKKLLVTIDDWISVS